MKSTRIRILIPTTLMLVCISSISYAANYYVDASSGSDSAAGTQAAPWKTVTKVNSTTLPAGSTVYFKAGGNYGSTILNAQSGSAGNMVTFTMYGTGSQPTMGAFNATGASYAKASGLSFSAAGTVVNLTTATYIIIDNCTITCTATSWAPGITIQTNSNHNQITKSILTEVVPAMNDLIDFRGNADYNLIAGNTITIAGIHAAIDIEGQSGNGTANYNIIKNNTIIGHNAAGCLINLATNSNYNVVDGNVLTGDGTLSGYCGVNTSARHEDVFKLLSTYNIVRNNVIKGYPCANTLGLTMEAYTYNGYTNNAIMNHIYNNVITAIGTGGTSPYLGTNGSGTVYNNYFKNNAIFNNGGTALDFNINGSGDGSWSANSLYTLMKVQVSSAVYNNYFQNNLFYTASSTGVMWVNNVYDTVAQAQSWNPTLYSGNLQTDPMLDPSTLRPLANSPVLEAGTSLTNITSASGSGSSIVVADAYYFTAGLGLTAGDIVQVKNQLATITAINYSTNTLTLNSTISWTQGDAVNLPFSGTAPDIGLLATASSKSLSPPSGLTVN